MLLAFDYANGRPPGHRWAATVHAWSLEELLPAWCFLRQSAGAPASASRASSACRRSTIRTSSWPASSRRPVLGRRCVCRKCRRWPRARLEAARRLLREHLLAQGFGVWLE